MRHMGSREYIMATGFSKTPLLEDVAINWEILHRKILVMLFDPQNGFEVRLTVSLMQIAGAAFFSLESLASEFGVTLAGLQLDQIIRVCSSTPFPRLIMSLCQILVETSRLLQGADPVIRTYIGSESSGSRSLMYD
jgi:hypothetical protein